MFRIANHHVSRIKTLLLLLEFFIAAVSVYGGVLLRTMDHRYLFSKDSQSLFISSLVFALIVLFSMSALGMYQLSFSKGIRNTLLRLMPSFALALILTTLVFYLMPAVFLGRGVLGLSLLLAASGIFIVRILVLKTSETGLLRSRTLFLGCGQLARECHDLTSANTASHEYSVVGFIPVANEECHVPSQYLLSTQDRLLDLVRKCQADEIVVVVQNRRGEQFPIHDLLECKLNGIKVLSAATFFEREACQIRVETLQPGWLVFGEGFNQSYLRRFGKRSFDLIVSATMFVMMLPLILITSLLIYLEDRGPVFYSQERVGKNGKTFMVLKFRSMGVYAEKNGNPQWATNNDPRTTRIGKIIRKLRIDELPQIINVLRGDMSFVGPRPERPFFVDQLTKEIPFYNMRHSLKPGITGMAQVRYAYGASVEDSVQKLQYDLYYVKNNSLFLDILILLETVHVVLFGKGAR